MTTPPESSGSRLVFSSTFASAASACLARLASALNPGVNLPDTDQVEQVDGGFQGRHTGVVLLSHGFELPGAFELVAPARRDDRWPELADPLGTDKEDAGFERAHRPLVRAGRVGIAAEVLEVQIARAEGLGPVHVEKDVAPAGQLGDRLDGIADAGRAGQVGDRDHAGARRDGLLDAGDQVIRGPRRYGTARS